MTGVTDFPHVTTGNIATAADLLQARAEDYAGAIGPPGLAAEPPSRRSENQSRHWLLSGSFIVLNSTSVTASTVPYSVRGGHNEHKYAHLIR